MDASVTSAVLGCFPVSQFPVGARVRRQELRHRLLPEGKEGERGADYGHMLMLHISCQRMKWWPCIWGAMMMKVMMSFQCFPEGTDMTAILDFYFQVNKNIPKNQLFIDLFSSSGCSLPLFVSFLVSCAPLRWPVRAPASWRRLWPTAASAPSQASVCWAPRRCGTLWAWCTPAACTTSPASSPSMSVSAAAAPLARRHAPLLITDYWLLICLLPLPGRASC